MWTIKKWWWKHVTSNPFPIKIMFERDSIFVGQEYQGDGNLYMYIFLATWLAFYYNLELSYKIKIW